MMRAHFRALAVLALTSLVFLGGCAQPTDTKESTSKGTITFDATTGTAVTYDVQSVNIYYYDIDATNHERDIVITAKHGTDVFTVTFYTSTTDDTKQVPAASGLLPGATVGIVTAYDLNWSVDPAGYPYSTADTATLTGSGLTISGSNGGSLSITGGLGFADQSTATSHTISFKVKSSFGYSAD